MGRLDEAPLLDVADAASWRAWLDANHDSATGAWLVIRRRGIDGPRPAYEEAVEEALSFGWIDSMGRRRDAASFLLYFAPRKRGGVWAATNKARVERLLAEGRMTPAGMAAVDAARADGSWEALTDVEALVEPPDLARAFASDHEARDAYDAMPPSARRITLYWLASTKRRETRDARIARIIADLRAGRRPGAGGSG